ncbi:MAG: quinol:electron acceptor oxidoreductase subunit ActD [Planctomycetota bacterium]
MSDYHATTAAPSEATQVVGLLAQFDSPEALLAAAAKVRDHGVKRWDSHSPYPIHGMERAMGVRMTPLPWLVLGAGITGAAAALLLQWWTGAVDYKIVVSGKPFFSLPAFIPITFELIVLFAAITAFLGALVLNLLPQFWHPVFANERFRRVTTDGFFISIDARDKKFDEQKLTEFLLSAGAVAIDPLRDTVAVPRFPSGLYWTLGTAAVLAILPPLLIAQYRAMPKKQPRIHLIQDMDFQPRFKPQGENGFFDDGRNMRPPVPGTVAVGNLEADERFYRGVEAGAPVTDFPIEVTDAVMLRGQQRFGIYCATCHGLVGEGGVTGITSARAVNRVDSRWTLPLSLHADSVREQPVGQIFQSITNGVRTMPAYGPQIPPEDRWAIVAYVRALQLSQRASIEDVPPERRNQIR